MSSNADKPLQSPLATKIEKLNNLNVEGTEKSMAVNVEISNILLWIATHHPEVFREEADNLFDVSVKRFYFMDSWENPDEIVSKDALATLFNSGFFYELKSFCGFVDPIVLDYFNKDPLPTIRLALGKNINIKLLMKKLKDRRVRHYRKDDFEEKISIHIRCCELDLEDLAPLPDINPKLYISNVSDQDAAWVVQAFAALRPKTDPSIFHEMSYPYIEALYLPRSKLTVAGVEAIVKGLFDAGVSAGLAIFWVSSPHLHEEKEIPGYEDISDWFDMISSKYDIEDVNCTDEDVEFTEFNDYIAEEDDDPYGYYGYGY